MHHPTNPKNNLEMAETAKTFSPTQMEAPGNTSQRILERARGNEIFIAVVGPVGAGAGQAADIIRRYLELETVDGQHFEAFVIKASDEIRRWAIDKGLAVPAAGQRKTIDGISLMQNHGDAIRLAASDNAAVARMAIGAISRRRAAASGRPEGELDGRPRAFIIDSLRHPAEVNLLRRVYQDAFSLVGVVCDQGVRSVRLQRNLFDTKDRSTKATVDLVAAFMDRDADAPEKYGQHVIDTFHEADFFVDNTRDATDDIAKNGMNEPLRRFVNLITAHTIDRPSVAETAMHQAHSAKLRSACLSRQVGAALVDAAGTVVAVGTNEVPKAGGGVYGETFSAVAEDARCAFRETRYCSSNREQNRIIGELIDDFPALTDGREREEVIVALRRTRIGGLIEFSRAVHAEMDAILSCARTGVSPRACRLYVSTFPCHYCARHIVSAGIDEVQFIEPYPKSQALALHSDSITVDEAGWTPPSTGSGKVLFKPFVGVAPRMYARVFLKDRDYKDKITGDYAFGTTDWGGPSDLYRVRYTELERDLGSVFQ